MSWIKDASQFNEDFIKNYNKESDERYFLEIDIEYLQKLNELHNDLLLLAERMKIEKVEKLVANLHHKAEYVKSYIDMNRDLRKKNNNNFEKDFLKLMNNAVFGKTMENVRKHRDIKLVTTQRRRNYLVSEPNYHTTKFFKENLLGIEMKKKQRYL